jgi:hypothetical protein
MLQPDRKTNCKALVFATEPLDAPNSTQKIGPLIDKSHSRGKSGQKMINDSHKIKLILVHGTWSPDAPWIQQGSALREAIKQHCSDCEEPDLCIWSGGNTVTDRQKASDKLSKQIESSSDQKHILIAHSHGGNVALQALNGEINKKPTKDSVVGVICLNTPFLVLLRKDTQHLMEFVFISLIGCVVSLFWVIVLIGHDLHYWPIWAISLAALLNLEKRLNVFKKIQSWGNKRWLFYKDKFNTPQLGTIPFLCVNSGADEAFALLSIIDGVSNIPSILVTRYFIGPVIIEALAYLLVLHKIAIHTSLFGLRLFKLIENSPFGFVTSIFKLPDLNSMGFEVSPKWPIVSAVFEIMGLSGIYSVVIVFSITILAVALGALSRVAVGTWREPLLPLFARQFVTLTPVTCEKVEFCQFDTSDDDAPVHSSLYNDPAVIAHIVGWINNIKP